MGGAIAKRPLQLKHHQPVTINAQAFERAPFMRFTANGAIEREPITGSSHRPSFRSTVLEWVGSQKVEDPVVITKES